MKPVTLENKTGKEITGFSAKSSEETAYPANMLPQGETFVAGENRDLYYAISGVTKKIGDESAVPMPAENADALSSVGESRDPDASSTASAKALPPQYDVQLTFADKTTAVLHAFPFGDTVQGSICQEGGVTFLQYLSTSSKEEVSTKDAEQKLLADAQASSTPESSKAPASSSTPASKAAASEDTAASQTAQKTDTEPASKPKTTSKPKSTPKASSTPKTSSKPKATTPDTNQGTTQTPNTTGGGNSDDGCLNGGLLW